MVRDWLQMVMLSESCCKPWYKNCRRVAVRGEMFQTKPVWNMQIWTEALAHEILGDIVHQRIAHYSKIQWLVAPICFVVCFSCSVGIHALFWQEKQFSSLLTSTDLVFCVFGHVDFAGAKNQKNIFQRRPRLQFLLASLASPKFLLRTSNTDFNAIMTGVLVLEPVRLIFGGINLQFIICIDSYSKLLWREIFKLDIDVIRAFELSMCIGWPMSDKNGGLRDFVGVLFELLEACQDPLLLINSQRWTQWSI